MASDGLKGINYTWERASGGPLTRTAQKLPLQRLRSPGTFSLAALAQMRSDRLGLAAPQVAEGRPRRGEWR